MEQNFIYLGKYSVLSGERLLAVELTISNSLTVGTRAIFPDELVAVVMN